jgi:hypothetical protein
MPVRKDHCCSPEGMGDHRVWCRYFESPEPEPDPEAVSPREAWVDAWTEKRALHR